MDKLAIGIDMGGHYIKAALIEGEKFLRRWEEPTFKTRTVEGVIDQLQGIVKQLQPPGYVLPVGVGVPGFLDMDREHVVLLPNFPGWEGLPLKSMLEDGLKTDVAIENDANCFALGEGLAGLAKGLKNLVAITLGTGIGGGIVLDGKLLKGAHGYAGEPGHMAFGKDEPCGCGCRGHLEAISGTDAMEKRAIRLGLPDDMEVLWPRRKEAAVAEIIRPSLNAIAKAIASIVHLLDPEMIILGGGFSRAEGLLQELKPLVQSYLVPHFRDTFRLEISSLGNDAALLGAASLVQDRSTTAA
ncbi:transcriptional regulator/sugar kinase [Acetomicrobium mobile DSM 13181]|uniref:Transcriptional regulator/sugar kinase n=1 Tax=Acetomicrobium mobile (strain ATCC BAA-54 / DSM 13181 / JCM 12221 / NGA) TaxID=891968 RepID=I4BUE0_ACEMN|nr:ROK family protein [Acetomicrobium mobile]AFM20897.1 transcriptional regulator/sugar kinase [Acetomicrobium mobile DSM 13181]